MMTITHYALPLALAQPCLSVAHAQEFPERTIRFISPAAPGGGNDIFARLAGQKLAEAFGKGVVIENRAGGGTIIGTDIVAKAPPDGHTLIMVTTNFIINPGLVPKMPYDSLRDLAPVAQLAATPLVLVVHPSVPANSVKSLIALAKTKPAQLNYASSGNGTAGHLAGVLLSTNAGITLTHIPYKGSAPALVDVISGQVQILFVSTPSVSPHMKSARLRALGVTSKVRSFMLPEIPTLDEAGLRGYEITQIYGVLAPGATPAPIIEKLNGVLVRALKTPEMIERLRLEGADAVGGTPEQFGQYIKTEVAKWIKVIKQSGARVD